MHRVQERIPGTVISQDRGYNEHSMKLWYVDFSRYFQKNKLVANFRNEFNTQVKDIPENECTIVSFNHKVIIERLKEQMAAERRKKHE